MFCDYIGLQIPASYSDTIFEHVQNLSAGKSDLRAHLRASPGVSVWNTDRRVLFCEEMLANRPHYLLQVVTMIWDAIDKIGCISISISTLVCGISVIGTIYHIGCEDTERKCKSSYHIRNGKELLTPNIVMYIILNKFVTEIESSIIFIPYPKTDALVNEFDNHNF